MKKILSSFIPVLTASKPSPARFSQENRDSIYRYEGLGTICYPEVGEFLSAGDISFRIHEGGHRVEARRHYFIEFTEAYLMNKNYTLIYRT